MYWQFRLWDHLDKIFKSKLLYSLVDCPTQWISIFGNLYLFKLRIGALYVMPICTGQVGESHYFSLFLTPQESLSRFYVQYINETCDTRANRYLQYIFDATESNSHKSESSRNTYHKTDPRPNHSGHPGQPASATSKQTNATQRAVIIWRSVPTSQYVHVLSIDKRKKSQQGNLNYQQ